MCGLRVTHLALPLSSLKMPETLMMQLEASMEGRYVDAE